MLELGDLLGKQVVQFLLAVDRTQFSGSMDDCEIPGWHDIPRFRVPGGRDVTVRAVKDDYSGLAAVESGVLRILPRDVAMDGSIRSGGAVEKHGDVSDPQGRRDGDEIDEREFVHEVVEEAAVVHQLRFGYVQRFGGGGLCLGAYACQCESGEKIAAFHWIIVAQTGKP